jgi:glutamine synthetase
MAPPSTSQVAFGLQYLPASVKLPTYGQGHVLEKLKSDGTRYIRFQWDDYTNITRYRIIPVTSFLELMSASRPGIGLTMAALGIVGTSLVPGFSGTGEYLYTPDLSSLRPCAYAPGHASLMGWFEEKLPTRESAGRQDDLKVPLCPRGLLRDIVKYVYLRFALLVIDNRYFSKGKQLGVEFLVGVETEFILLKSTDPISAVNDAPYSASRGLLAGSVAEKCLEDIADALQYGGIDLLMYHTEAAPGQVWNYDS